jgi:predicted DCC family thiol-disulfide oxidoreductase YuxK
MSTDASEPRGWILYDDSCGVCRRWVPRWGTTLRKRGFETAPLQSEWVAQRLALSAGDLVSDVRLLLADGTQIRGADVYRYAMRRIWWTYPLYLVSITPLLRRVFDRGYRTFADHRHRFSGACGSPGAARHES